MTEDPVERAIRLSLIDMDERARQSFTKEIRDILSFVAAVQTVETDSLPVQGKKNVLRDDVVTVKEGAYHDAVIRQAPASYRRWLVSKKII